MVYQIKPIISILEIEKDEEIEIEFPGTDAKVTTQNANGFNIDYIDNLNKPQSIFIWGRSWGIAREKFEDTIEHSLIDSHRAARMAYDY